MSKLSLRCLTLLLIVMMPELAWAKSGHKAKSTEPSIPSVPPIITTYDVYVGGVHLVKADILFQEQKPKYHLHIQTRSYGMWHDLFPWDAVLDAEGKIKKDRFVPAVYTDLDIWKKRPKLTKLDFDTKGNVTPSFDPPSHDENREIVTAEQRRGSLDPITGLLQMLANIALKNSCNVTVPLFDGKRRFDVSGTDDGTEDIDEADYNAYKGPARLCNVDFTMIAGEWKDRETSGFWKKNDKENGREPFHIWLASVAPGLPDLPVRLQSGSVWGLIVMHMSKWRYATPADLQIH